jgi:Bacterial protein of unknown function (DUF899)
VEKHKVGTREEWLAARNELLAKEKELTRRNDQIAAERRGLPWVPIGKEYRFGTGSGPRTLAGLFDGRSQLLVYHFMFGPDYTAQRATTNTAAGTRRAGSRPRAPAISRSSTASGTSTPRRPASQQTRLGSVLKPGIAGHQ